MSLKTCNNSETHALYSKSYSHWMFLTCTLFLIAHVCCAASSMRTLLGAPWHIIQFYFAENTVAMCSTPVTGTSPTPTPLPNYFHEETHRPFGRADSAAAGRPRAEFYALRQQHHKKRCYNGERLPHQHNTIHRRQRQSQTKTYHIFEPEKGASTKCYLAV